jgi:phosphotransferase system  glucose/maltose/N-acetylglucosamine-specific IIC component
LPSDKLEEILSIKNLKTMNNSVMFIVGLVIFCAYMFSYLAMISKANKDQEEEMKRNSEL